MTNCPRRVESREILMEGTKTLGEVDQRRRKACEKKEVRGEEKRIPLRKRFEALSKNVASGKKKKSWIVRLDP